jgi:hypothetical protein
LEQQVAATTTRTGITMRFKKSMALGAAAVTAVSLSAATVVGTSPAGASARAGIPTVTVHVGGGKIGFVSGNSTLHAGRITFRAITGSGSHGLQIIRLHHGYSLAQAGPDFGKAFSGDTAAIARLDDNVSFRGGVGVSPSKPGVFTVTLRAGHFYFLDLNSNALKAFTVVGALTRRPNVAHQSRIDAFSYGFTSDPLTIPASGTVFFFNHADQPHFLEMQHVKDGTTAAQVRRFIKNGAQGNPPWGLRGGAGSGVLSPNYGEMMRYDLPAGEYLLACFWPDRFTGMPHFFMGMWKLIHLA